MTTIEIVIAFVSALGLGAILKSIIDSLINRRKARAEVALAEKECERTDAEVDKTRGEFVEIFQRAYKNLLDELKENIQKQGERIIALEVSEVMKNDQILVLQQALLVKDKQIESLETEVAELRKIIYDLTGKKPPRRGGVILTKAGG